MLTFSLWHEVNITICFVCGQSLAFLNWAKVCSLLEFLRDPVNL